jgi:hypothetical protein
MSSHWYKRDGSMGYDVIGKNGKSRPFNLRWDRELGYVPSVTTITEIINKPALTSWKIDQAIMAALTLPRLPNEPESDWIGRVKTDASQQAKDAADEGTRIHDAIENFIKGKPYDAQYQPHVEATINVIKENFPDVNDWVSESSFAHATGYGGKVDLHSPSTGIIIDFKGKDFTEQDLIDKKKFAYDQNIQLSAYQQGLGFGISPCANVFVSRNTKGLAVCHVWNEAEMLKGLDIFNATLALWKAIKGYDGSFVEKVK